MLRIRGLDREIHSLPISLFVCRNLSHLLRKTGENNSLSDIKIAPPTPSVNHLLFADDYIIFSRASLQDSEATKKALHM